MQYDIPCTLLTGYKTDVRQALIGCIAFLLIDCYSLCQHLKQFWCTVGRVGCVNYVEMSTTDRVTLSALFFLQKDFRDLQTQKRRYVLYIFIDLSYNRLERHLQTSAQVTSDF